MRCEVSGAQPYVVSFEDSKRLNAAIVDRSGGVKIVIRDVVAVPVRLIAGAAATPRLALGESLPSA